MTTATVAKKNGKSVVQEPEEKFEPHLCFAIIYTTYEQKHLLEELRRIGAPIAHIVIAVNTPEQEAALDDSLFDWGSWSGDDIGEDERYIGHRLAV